MEIIIIGGDKRYITLFNKLKETYNTKHLKTQKELNSTNINTANIIIIPITGIKNNNTIISLYENITININSFKNLNKDTLIYTGIINQRLKELFPNNKIISFLDDEDVKKENNNLTVAGILDEIEKEKPNKICILGYGNIGKALYLKLKQQNFNVIVGIKEEKDFNELKEKAFYTTDEEKMTYFLTQCDYIVNTVPENIIKSSYFKNNEPIILDIASFPYGMSNEEKMYIKTYRRYPGIPTKKAPYQAGKILYKKLKKDLKGGIK